MSEPADAMLVPLSFIIDAYEGIGFAVVEERENPDMIVLRRNDAVVFFNSLDGWVDLSFVAQDAESCEVMDELFMYLAAKYGATPRRRGSHPLKQSKLIHYLHAEVLDFPDVISWGRELNEARQLLSSALVDMAELNLERGEPLPQANPAATDPDSDLEEPIYLLLQATTRVTMTRESGMVGALD